MIRFSITTGIILCFFKIGAQNIGLGNSVPISPLHISAPVGNIITVENTSALAIGTQAGINFANNLSGPYGYKFTGAIRTIGTATTDARLGFFTYATSQPNNLKERLSILDNGNVGIGTVTPAYKLDVNGNSFFNGRLAIQTTTPLDTSYSLDVGSIARFQDDLQVSGVLNPNNDLLIGNSVYVEGEISVSGGKGIVRNTGAAQLRIKRSQATFSGSIPAGGSNNSAVLNFGEDFNTVTITTGQVTNASGEWMKVMITPFNVNNVNKTWQFKFTNTSNNDISFTGTWSILMTGD